MTKAEKKALEKKALDNLNKLLGEFGVITDEAEEDKGGEKE